MSTFYFIRVFSKPGGVPGQRNREAGKPICRRGTRHGGTPAAISISTGYARGQIAQVLTQIDKTLESIKSDRTRLLQVLVYMADQNDAATLNELWDAWVPAGHSPVRAMVQVALGGGCKVELVVTAADLEG